MSKIRIFGVKQISCLFLYKNEKNSIVFSFLLTLKCSNFAKNYIKWQKYLQEFKVQERHT